MKKFDQINVIPMIDVMLVLLAIVLTTATFIAQDKLNIELPKTQQTQQAKPSQLQKALRIAINAKNQIFVNEQTATLNQLKLHLEHLIADQPIVLRVDRKADFGTFTQVIDLLKAHQRKHLTILTEHKA